MQPTIRVSAVVLWDEHRRFLTVRKRGTTRFMFPGGKPEPGEDAAQTAVRECLEEVGVLLDRSQLRPLGEFEAPAANERDHRVQAAVFEVTVPTEAVMQAAEIEEVRWVAIDGPWPEDLAPLLAEQVLPYLRSRGSGSA